MISRDQVQQLIERPSNGRNILSAFLDMSVSSDNKRTYRIFLNKEKAAHQELDSDREGKHREALGEAFARLERWVDSNFDEANKGVALYLEIDGDWTQGHQFPLPVKNRLAFDTRPVVGPLLEIVERYRHHGVILVDREHLRLLSFYLDRTVHEREVKTEPFPAPHDVKRGGFSAPDYQARKAEETRHFFKDFAGEVEDYVRTHRPDDLTVLGTHENIKRFIEYLPPSIRDTSSIPRAWRWMPRAPRSSASWPRSSHAASTSTRPAPSTSSGIGSDRTTLPSLASSRPWSSCRPGSCRPSSWRGASTRTALAAAPADSSSRTA